MLHGLSLLLGPFWDKKDDPMGAMQNLIDDQADEISELRHGGMADDRGLGGPMSLTGDRVGRYTTN